MSQESNSLIGGPSPSPDNYQSLDHAGLPPLTENNNDFNPLLNDNFDNDLSINDNDDIDTDFNNLSNDDELDNDTTNNNGMTIPWLNSMTVWAMPHLDHASWFCIGIYLLLMILVPFLRDGSTSIVFGLNCIIFLMFVYWYAWFSNTTINDSIKFVATGFYIVGSVAFILGIGTYYFLGLPSDLYCYYTAYESQYYEEYITILECFAIAFLAIACTQQYLIYHLMTRGPNMEIMHSNDVNSKQKVIGGAIGMSIGLVCCVNTLSIILFDMQWESRVELYCIRAAWAIPLAICTSYLIGAGITDREILRYNTTTYGILLLPILYNTIAYFQLIALVALHTQLVLRPAVMIASMCMNLVVCSAVCIDVWQRHLILNTKQRMRENEMRLVPV